MSESISDDLLALQEALQYGISIDKLKSSVCHIIDGCYDIIKASHGTRAALKFNCELTNKIIQMALESMQTVSHNETPYIDPIQARLNSLME